MFLLTFIIIIDEPYSVVPFCSYLSDPITLSPSLRFLCLSSLFFLIHLRCYLCWNYQVLMGVNVIPSYCYSVLLFWWQVVSVYTFNSPYPLTEKILVKILRIHNIYPTLSQKKNSRGRFRRVGTRYYTPPSLLYHEKTMLEICVRQLPHRSIY